MSKTISITVLGATGFAGANIVTEALQRGHQVTAVSRSAAEIPGVRTVQGSILDLAVLDQALEGAEVVVGALSPRGDMAGRVADAYAQVADKIAGSDTRFIVVGGFGSMKAADGGRIVDGPDFPAPFRAESRELFSTLEALRGRDDVNWTYVSPAADFGSYIEDQKRRGTYRLGTDVPIFDAEGRSAISGPDYAIGIVDEVEKAEHGREHISLAY
ncbi:NAD(P)-dependent oxidoreductase [Parenemella sanctibonifatiensis]|uniref:NAD-dependent epimerase n=1 Tax=Parenemella sanctibonifatiensis TaxID=2016505 RepID=A0A255EAK9_9ACTN|nr:NAD(P)H-binding protein [Parenemella sanctibonifatiensis]OYN86442.1 NAD-dependent epimerase [Parenemella sanctibonifatiensis]